MRPSLNFAAISAAALLVAGCNLVKGKETTGQYVDDTTITARAKAATSAINRRERPVRNILSL